VIHEYLFVPDYNRMTKKYLGGFKDFHGIYASVQNVGDLYFHTQKSTFFLPLIEQQEGFLFLNGQGAPDVIVAGQGEVQVLYRRLLSLAEIMDGKLSGRKRAL